MLLKVCQEVIKESKGNVVTFRKRTILFCFNYCFLSLIKNENMVPAAVILACASWFIPTYHYDKFLQRNYQ